MLSFVSIYSLQQPSCIMVAMVLLRCYQYHRCYDHIWAANCKSLSRSPLPRRWHLLYIYFTISADVSLYCLTLSTNILIWSFFLSFKVTFTIFLFYNLCRCILVLSYTKYKHINNDLSFYPSRWPLLYTYFIISADVSLYCLTLSTNILIMIHLLSSWSLLYIYFTICRFTLVVLTSTKYKHINNAPSSFKLIFTIYLFYNLYTLCTGYTEYKDICNNLLLSAGIIEHIMSTEEEHYICVLKGVLHLSTNKLIFY